MTVATLASIKISVKKKNLFVYLHQGLHYMISQYFKLHQLEEYFQKET